MSTAVCIDGLWWRYPTYSDKPNPWTLRDVTLNIAQGECFGITGPSGAGKTTLSRAMIGILPYSARLTAEQLPQHFRGNINVMDEPVTATTASTHKIGMVLQDPENQFLRMSLLHELALGLQIQGLSQEEIVERARQALRWVGLEHLWQGALYRHPADLSGGQKQRVAIAAFLALRPQVLILDEPTSDLDPVGRREVIETIARLRREEQMTIILIEQDPEILASFCDRIALLDEGRVELVASPREFYAERDVLEASGASAGEFARISWRTGYTYNGYPPLTLEQAEVAFSPARARLRGNGIYHGTRRETQLAPVAVEGMSARLPYVQAQELQASPSTASVLTPSLGNTDTSSLHMQPREPIARAECVTYNYEDGTTALKGVDVTLHRGEMVALLGPNGSGKTTFAKILAGLYSPTGGRISILGREIATRKARAQLAGSVGYVFQNPDHQLFCRKVSDEIEYGLKNLGIPAAQRRKTVAGMLDAVDLASYADEDPLFLSKGQRQRLAVAAILAMRPEILVVDEPTTGQDYRSITSIMQLLCRLQQAGRTVLVITHDMTLVAEYCQRIIAFRDGHLAFNGTPTELFEEADALAKTGLRSPTSAALSMRIREKDGDFPPLITVEQWSQALGRT